MGYFFLVMGVPLIPTILLMLWYNHKRKEIENWKLGVVYFVCSLICMFSWFSYQEYERKLRWANIEAEDKIWRDQQVQREAERRAEKASGMASERSSGGSSSGVASSYSGGSYDASDGEYESEYDDGYDDGYWDGMYRDHGANKRDGSYDYDDGYSQGYYDAVHEDEDWEDDEEEDW